MAEQFHLGFDIDTTSLAQAKQAAQDAAQAIGKLGDAEQSLGQQSTKAVDQQKKLNDELKKTGDAHKSAASGADDLQKAIHKTTGTVTLSAQQIASLGAILGSGMGGGGGIASAFHNVALGAHKFSESLGPIGTAAVGGTAVITALGYATYKLAEPLAEAADRSALLQARLTNALGSVSTAKTTFEALYEQTQKTGLGFNAAADSFNRLARNAEALGASRDSLLQLSDTIQKLGAASGASRGEIQSGMVQLSQALASGKLNGDELRSIMENMPALAKAIADGLGVSVGQIRSMGAAGELTGQKVFQSILKSSAKANEEFAKLPDTVEKANQRAADSYDRFLSLLGEKWNASGFVRGATNFFADLINKANEALKPESVGSQIAGLQQRRAAFAKLPGRNSEREVASIDRQIEALRKQGQSEMAGVSAANEASEAKLNRAFIVQGAEIGSNEFDEYNKKLIATRQNLGVVEEALAGVQIRMKMGAATDEDRSLLPSLTRQVALGKAELADLIVGVDRLKRDLSDSNVAKAMGGGGGGVSIVQSAIEQQRAASQKIAGGGALGDYIEAGIRKAALASEGQIETLQRQARQQDQLTSQIGLTSDATREMSIATESAQFRFEKFGTLQSSVIDGFMKRYTEALRKNKEAIDANATAQANYNNQIEIAITKAQGGAAGNGGLQRAIAASMRAAMNPNTFDSEMDKFNAGENLNAQNQIAGIQQSTVLSRLMAASTGTDRDRQLQQLEFNITAAQRNLTPVANANYGQQLADEMRKQDSAQFDADRANEVRGLQRSIDTGKRRAGIAGLPTEELRVQTAILEKQLQLEQQGLSSSDDNYRTQISLTEQLERQNIELEKQRSKYDAIYGSVDTVASNAKSAFADAWVNSFKTGDNAAKAFFKSLGDMTQRASAEMTYEIAIKPLVTLAANVVKMGLSNYLNFGGTSTASSTPSQYSLPTQGVKLNAMEANGAVYGLGGVRAFASGGVFTNGIFTQPTMFRFAGGGSFGVMGEAGPEAVMPLRRGSDGKLGVAASGGGGGDVQVIVNDMRTNKDSSQVEVSQQSGPNGMRQIQIMVRDEIKRSMSSGEFDRTMQTNFGTNRQIARK